VDTEEANEQIRNIIGCGIKFLESFYDQRYFLEYLYLAVYLRVYSKSQRLEYANLYLNTINKIDSEDIIKEYRIYTAMIYNVCGAELIDNDIELQEDYLHKALDIVMDLYEVNGEDKDVLWGLVKVYTSFTCIYSWQKADSAIEYGHRDNIKCQPRI